MDVNTSLHVAAAGLHAQSGRMRVIAENLANANSTTDVNGGEPYRRRIPTTHSSFDREVGANLVAPGDPVFDQREFRMRYDPGNPSADAQGYIKTSNVDGMVEMMDMRDAQRAYQANLQVMEAARSMLVRTIDLLRR